MTQEKPKINEKSKESIQKVNVDIAIKKSMNKLNLKKESELCKYIPDDGYQMHFKRFQKIKKDFPSTMIQLLQQHADIDNPKTYPSRPRNKRPDEKFVKISYQEMSTIIKFARKHGDKEILSMILPKQSIHACKRELMNSIRNLETRKELWDAYCHLVSEMETENLEKIVGSATSNA